MKRTGQRWRGEKGEERKITKQDRVLMRTMGDESVERHDKRKERDEEMGERQRQRQRLEQTQRRTQTKTQTHRQRRRDTTHNETQHNTASRQDQTIHNTSSTKPPTEKNCTHLVDITISSEDFTFLNMLCITTGVTVAGRDDERD